MIREEHIHTLEDLLPLLTEQDYRPDLDRNRSTYLYRGVPDSEYKMTTSLSRNCKQLQIKLEPAILDNYAKYAVQEEDTVRRSVWYSMISGQHNGLPTRLLDWSHSALVGLHFAVTEDNLEHTANCAYEFTFFHFAIVGELPAVPSSPDRGRIDIGDVGAEVAAAYDGFALWVEPVSEVVERRHQLAYANGVNLC